MPDTHEERLLSELLHEVAAADATLGNGDLESRAMAHWDVRESAPATREHSVRRGMPWIICGIAAAVLAAIVLARPARQIRHDGANATAAPVASPALNLPDAGPAGGPVVTSVESDVTPRAAVRRAQPRRQPARIEDDALSFVPLVPMSGQELSGSFQIARVRMPRASLGALAATLDPGRFDDFVEADVLLSEDGMARAIRVSTSGTTYPRRSR